jgi:dTDP-4-amino-4,6-dideoxygalactose transaminase
MKMKQKIKLFDPHVDNSEKNAILKTLDSHFWASGSGTGNVKKFELKFQNYVKSKNCIAVNSGTSALNLALSLMDIKNKEVILPSLSFVSTAHAVLLNGGKPVFVDIDPKTLCINPDEIKKHITSKTKLILPVHFAGMPCDLSEIQKICNSYDINFIEDAAHASGSTFKNKKIGSHGFAVCFSFHPVKNLAMPTGGIISLNDKNYKIHEKKLLSRRWCGITNRHNFDYDVKEIGWNYYMNEFSAAIGISQLKKLNKLNKIRKKIAKRYDDEIEISSKIPFSNDCSYHLYWIQVKNRNSFMKQMSNSGIETGIHYKPIHSMSMYASKHNLPLTDEVGKKIVSLPIHPNLSEFNIDKIIKSVNQFSK